MGEPLIVETLTPPVGQPPTKEETRLNAAIRDVVSIRPWIPPLWLVRRRLRERWLLLLATFAGLVAAVTLVSAIPLYSNAEAEKLLQQDLDQRARQGQLAVAYRYTASQPGALDAERHEQLDAQIRSAGRSWLGIQSVEVISAGESATQAVSVLRSGRYQNIFGPVTTGYAGYRHDLFSHVDVVDGRLPSDMVGASGEIEAIISAEAADNLPIKRGDHVVLHDDTFGGAENPPLKIAIVGVFRPHDSHDRFWYGAPDTYQRRLGLFVAESVFHRDVMPIQQPFGASLTWYFLFPQRDVTSNTADRLVAGLEFTGLQISQDFRGTVIDRSIYAAFARFDEVVGQLRFEMTIFAAPIVAIVLYYTALVTSLLAESQRSEIAVLHSRGARNGQIVSLVTTDVACLMPPALAAGLVLGILLTRLIGSTFGFLLFAEGVTTPVRFGTDALVYGVIGLALALVTVVVASANASRDDVVTRSRALSRVPGRSWWQRYYVDILLLVVAAYGYQRLRDLTGLVSIGSRDVTGPPVVEPLVLVLPVLFLAAWGLLVVRCLPLCATVLTWVVGFLPSFSLTMALRQLARSPGQYTALALLLVWTIGMGSFSAAVARTLDRRAADDVDYQVGSDVRFDEQGFFDTNLQSFVYAPIEDAARTPGVRGATRVLSTQLRQEIVQPYGPVHVLGIDRQSFPNGSWFRRDFADAPLGELMNRLAVNPSGVLVDRSFARAANLDLGSELALYTDVGNEPVSFVVVGILDYFPTLYPGDGPYVVANYEYVHDWFGDLPQQLWLRVDPTVAMATLQARLQEQNFILLHGIDARLLLKDQRSEPLRVGTFGILGVGFLAGVALTVLGLIMHTILEFRRRIADLGVLRVLGLSVGQLSVILIVEHVLIVSAGAAAGGAAGVITSKMMTPFLLSTEVGKRVGVPPVLPVAPWDDLLKVWGVLAIMVLLTVPTLVIGLARRRLAEGLRIGQVVE